ncbi:MAG: (2Fe-2S)-binding protein [Planctomycetota bacterium]|nr:MAG: (2Fe-2S)-binding protein [Planctomycetota bacterium]REK26806.1 MAG: (2Fe-2S)-binding protein [Planctomycetota bacterium]REK40777.1 MAG: (2Fe-2S)-binding protein [Planctomycetota bacterium]
MPTVKFIREKKEIDVPEGTNLRKAAIQAGVNLYQGVNGYGETINKFLNCHGWGFCGTCTVGIEAGKENLSPMGTWEKLKFHGLPTPDPLLATINCMHFIGNEDRLRLACKTIVNGDVEVETGPEFNATGENFFS